MPISRPSPDQVTSVTIDVIPHSLQRYETCGDYRYDPSEGHLWITVSQGADWREAMAVAVHELVEALLVIQAGIPIAAIDAFDQAQSGDADEPGEMAEAPYYDQHLTATVVERLFAHAVGLHWPRYEDDIYALAQPTAQSEQPTDAGPTAERPPDSPPRDR